MLTSDWFIGKESADLHAENATKSASVDGALCRVMFLTSCLFGLLIFIVYPAMLTSYMSVPSNAHPVKSVEDILPLGYKVIVLQNSAHMLYMKFSPKGNNIKVLL